jgi:hypothetical protein
MTPEQQTEYEQDMRSFRSQFIHELALELAHLVPPTEGYTGHQYAFYKQFQTVLDSRLPGALEVLYPVLTIEDPIKEVDPP